MTTRGTRRVIVTLELETGESIARTRLVFRKFLADWLMGTLGVSKVIVRQVQVNAICAKA